MTSLWRDLAWRRAMQKAPASYAICAIFALG
jgi:hypothetical protein